MQWRSSWPPTRPVDYRPHLLDYFLKRQIEALWARNLYVHLYYATAEWQKLTRRAIPSNAIPRYARGMMDARGPKEALSYLTREAASYRLAARCKSDCSLERALCLYNVGNYKASLLCLDRVDRSNRLGGE